LRYAITVIEVINFRNKLIHARIRVIGANHDWMSLTPPRRNSKTRSRLPEFRLGATFSSLQTRNFRLFATGQLFSNTGTWVQRIAQDWLVLSLTGSATDVGITTALQFLPTLLFGLIGGLIADRYPKRAILLVTQASMGVIAGILAFLTLTHQVTAWQVYVIAFGLGVVTAVDNPTRQAFANEMVGPHQLSNAISINSSVFQLGGLIGPAISGALITQGSGQSRFPCSRGWCEAEEGVEQGVVVFGGADGGGDVVVAGLADEPHAEVTEGDQDAGA
jgi:MFS family permease